MFKIKSNPTFPATLTLVGQGVEQQEKTLAACIALVVSLFEPVMLVLMGGVVAHAFLLQGDEALHGRRAGTDFAHRARPKGS